MAASKRRVICLGEGDGSDWPKICVLHAGAGKQCALRSGRALLCGGPDPPDTAQRDADQFRRRIRAGNARRDQATGTSPCNASMNRESSSELLFARWVAVASEFRTNLALVDFSAG